MRNVKEKLLTPEERRERKHGTGVRRNTVDKDIQRLQAMAIIARKVQGATLQDLEKEFEFSRETVRHRVQLAKRENLLGNAADQVVSQLLPLAMNVFINALHDGDVKVARDVLYGSGVLSKGNRAQIAPTDVMPEGPPTLDEIRARYEELTTVDGEVVTPLGLPPHVRELGDDDDDEDSTHFAGAADEDQDHEDGGRVFGDFSAGSREGVEG